MALPHRLNSAYHLCRLPFTSILKPNRHTHIHSQSSPRHRRRHLNRIAPERQESVISNSKINIK